MYSYIKTQYKLFMKIFLIFKLWWIFKFIKKKLSHAMMSPKHMSIYLVQFHIMLNNEQRTQW